MNGDDIRMISNVYHNMICESEDNRSRAWKELMAQIEEERDEDGDIDLAQFVWDIHEHDLFSLVPNLYSDYFGDPETYSGVVYHSTTEDNVESINENGLRPENRTRGITNRGIGSAIFTSHEPDPMQSYGEILVTIDLDKARKLNPDIQTGLESPIEEYLRRSVIASELGIEDTYQFEPSSSDGVREDTLVIYGHVPREAITIEDDDGNIIE